MHALRSETPANPLFFAMRYSGITPDVTSAAWETIRVSADGNIAYTGIRR